MLGFAKVILKKLGLFNPAKKLSESFLKGFSIISPFPSSRLAYQHLGHPDRIARINLHILEILSGFETSSKPRALEIGGRRTPRRELLEGKGWGYENMDLEGGEGSLCGDITKCPEIPDNSYDLVLSVDVFEHIKEPWKAASEIVRILKPGGVAYTSTLFSWRYHPCPVDYWRFSPEALAFLFASLEELAKGFDDTERRRNIVSNSAGGFRIQADSLGGWRENWRAYYWGRKP